VCVSSLLTISTGTPPRRASVAYVWRLRGIPRKRHYVDGWVMWPAGVFPLLGLSLSPVPAT
jgi:hypothetical protein